MGDIRGAHKDDSHKSHEASVDGVEGVDNAGPQLENHRTQDISGSSGPLTLINKLIAETENKVALDEQTNTHQVKNYNKETKQADQQMESLTKSRSDLEGQMADAQS